MSKYDMNQPLISVIMGTYNCDKTINESIDSIITQTYENWEFIICDDCSTDNTYSILHQYKLKYPDKFKIIKNNENRKLAFSLNRCLDIAEGELIARMDGDDISVSTRFDKQVDFLIKNPSYNLVGTTMQRFDGDIKFGSIDMPEYPDKYILKRRVPFAHATIMTYKKVFKKLDGYTVLNRTQRSQDYDLWFKFMAAGYKGYNIQEDLYLVREDLKAVRRRTFKNRCYILQTAIIGFRKLRFPLHWYVLPFLDFLKFLVPGKLIMMSRKNRAKVNR